MQGYVLQCCKPESVLIGTGRNDTIYGKGIGAKRISWRHPGFPKVIIAIRETVQGGDGGQVILHAGTSVSVGPSFHPVMFL